METARRIGAAALPAAGALGLAACSSAQAAPTPTPTPIVSNVTFAPTNGLPTEVVTCVQVGGGLSCDWEHASSAH
jgi:hypothetical protein